MKKAVVAGHICLDIIPAFDHPVAVEPGRLYEVGAATVATGGVVSNTGIALHILGIPTTLAGKIGNDMFGNAVIELLRAYSGDLCAGMIVDPAATTSYTFVLSIPEANRTFFHCPGANHTFGGSDIDPDAFDGAALFHFGYPPLMGRTYADQGRELVAIYRRVKYAGITTSLDMTMPDPGGPSGQADWESILQRTLPHVDLFIPSADELLYMLDRERFGRGDDLDGDEVSELGSRLLDMGVAVAGVKLGTRGLYLRTASEERLGNMGFAAPSSCALWANRELWFPIYNVPHVAGATGAGDATYAGFLAALLRGLTIEEAGTIANAVGACNVSARDALGGICGWEDTLAKIADGWERVPLDISGAGWSESADTHLWHGPRDRP